MTLAPRQLSFDLYREFRGAHFPKVAAAIEKLSPTAATESRGAIFTRAEVVDFILDLVGYTAGKPLYKNRLLEPSFGAGDFLLPILGRLLATWRAARSSGLALDDLGDAVRAVGLHRETFQATHAAVIALLKREGLKARTAMGLASRWLTQGDFLLAPLDGQFDFVVGNPPYVRQEMIPAPLLSEYRGRYQTMYDLADLYIPFIFHRTVAFGTLTGWPSRHDLLCQKLVQERLYTTAALNTSTRSAVTTGKFSELSVMTSLKTFVATLAGHIAAEAAWLGDAANKSLPRTR